MKRWQAALALVFVVSAAFAATPQAMTELRSSARAWQANGRADLARVALEKALAAEPDDATTLLQYGLLEIDSNHMEDAAKLLARLRTAHPDDRRVRELEDAYRIATQDRMRMANTRRLLQSGEIEQANAGLRELFPDGAPGSLLGIEYYRALSRMDGRRDEGLAGLKRLQAENPDNPEFELAIARHYLGREATRPQGLAMLETLASRPDLQRRRVLDLWRDGLSEQTGSADDRAMLRRYLLMAPDDTQMLALQTRWQQHPTAATAIARNTPERTPPERIAAIPRLSTPPPRRTTIVTEARSSAIPVPADIVIRAEPSSKAIPLSATPPTPHYRGRYAGIARGMQIIDTFDVPAQAAPVAPFDRQPAPQPEPVPEPKPDPRPLQLQQLQAEARHAADLHDAAGTWRAANAALLLTPDDPWLRYRMARQLQRAGDDATARGLMEDGARRYPGDDLFYAQALLLAGSDPRAAQAALARIPPAGRSAGMQRLQSRLQMRPLLSAGGEQLRGGDRASGESLLDAASALAGADPRLQAEVAEAWIDAGQPRRALDELHRQSLNQPETPDALLARTGTLQSLLTPLPEVEPEYERQLSRLNALALTDADQSAEREALNQTRAERLAALRNPTRVTTAAAPVTTVAARAESSLPVSAATPAPLPPPGPAMITTAVDWSEKPGDAGISHYRSWQWLNRYQQGLFGGRLELQADWVDASAGTLPANFAAAAEFGQLQAVGPAAGLPSTPVDQSAQGVAPTIAYERGPWRVDLGSTPLGFLVHSWSGGLRYAGDLGPLDYSLEAYRRPVTSSFISYAGARDIVSGQTWGGVQRSGLGARLAHYERRWSVFASGGASQFDGRAVANNSEWGLRTGGDVELLGRDDQRLYLGLSLAWQQYANNQRFYNFGQGGYYSPQRRLAIGLPLDWRGGNALWSWQLLLQGAYSNTYEDDAPFFPTRPDLQAAAATRLAASGDTAIHIGGRGGGFGYSLAGALERRLGNGWTLGARADLDRSEFYEPTEFNLYLRHPFDGTPGGPLIPPRPLRPNSER